MMIFEVAMEYGKDSQSKDLATSVLRHRRIAVSSGREYQLRVRAYQDYGGNHWISVVPRSAAEILPINVRTEDQAEIVLAVLDLVVATTFRFAMAGVDVELLRTFDELMSENHNFFEQDEVSWMLEASIWRRLGEPAGFASKGLYMLRVAGVVR